jgi:hypothetical protein
MGNMNYRIVDIFEYSFEYFPGWVSCKCTDAFGKIHCFYEKIPVVSTPEDFNVYKNTILPQKGYIAGEIINKENGIITFSTIKPCDIETNEKISVFCVYENQIINEIEYTLIEKIKYLADNNDIKILENNSCEYSRLYKEIHKIIIDYKNDKGTQGKAYSTIMELYKLYNEQNIEEKVDFIADILDMIVGNIGNREYLIWEEYLKT